MDSEATAPEEIAGEFEGGGFLGSEQPSELTGRGTLTVLDEGLRVVGTWRPRTRRVMWAVLAVFALPFGGMLAVSSHNVAEGVLVAGGGVLALVKAIGAKAVPYERVVPWGELKRPGLSEGVVIFEVSAPRRGVVRFRVPGWPPARTRQLAQEIVRRTRA